MVRQLVGVVVASILVVNMIAEPVDSGGASPDPIQMIDVNSYATAKSGGKALVDAQYRALLPTASRAEAFRIFSGMVSLHLKDVPGEPPDHNESKKTADEFLRVGQTLDRYRLDMLNVAAKLATDFDPDYAADRATEMVETFPSQDIAKIRAYSILGDIATKRGGSDPAIQFYEAILDYQPVDLTDTSDDAEEIKLLQRNSAVALVHVVSRGESGTIAKHIALSSLYERYPQIASWYPEEYAENRLALRVEIEDDVSSSAEALFEDEIFTGRMNALDQVYVPDGSTTSPASSRSPGRADAVNASGMHGAPSEASNPDVVDEGEFSEIVFVCLSFGLLALCVSVSIFARKVWSISRTS